LIWGIPVVRDLGWHLNDWLLVRGAWWLDRVTDREGYFALGYVAAARKPAEIQPHV